MTEVSHRAVKLARKVAWEGMRGVTRLQVDDLGDRRPAGTDPAHQDVVRRVRGAALIEPMWGYVIGLNGHLVEDAIRTNRPMGPPPWRMAMPSLSDAVRRRRAGPPHVMELPAAASLRHWYEWNYHHFHFDVLGKIAVLEDAGVPQDMPLVLGRYAIELPFVQEVLGMGSLASRNWVVQDHCYIRAEEIYYCHARRDHRQRMERVLELMELPPVAAGPGRRIFLNRGGSATRRIVNVDGVRRVLEQHGFEEVDGAQLTVHAQIDLFSNTRQLVAAHGAGLANVIYRRGEPLSILELYGTYNSFEYREIAEQYGYRWAGLEGRPVAGPHPQQADFVIDERLLDERLSALLAAD